jgi:hypothetical protein
MQVCEALLRYTAAVDATADKIQDFARMAGADQPIADSDAEGSMTALVGVLSILTNHRVTGDGEHHASVLALAALSAGPGSDLLRQLFSLLCTMAKVACASFDAKDPAKNWECLVTAAASTAAAVIADSAGLAGSTTTDSGSSGSSGSHADAVPVLPALFILGRCCMHPWDQDQQSARVSDSLAETPQMDGTVQEYSLAERILPPVQQWLQASSTQEQLVAAGCSPQALPQQLQQVVTAVQVVGGSASSTQFEEATQQLRAAGSALCSFAVPCLCNNPCCSNLSGLTELGLVSGRSCICAGCQVARYCGRACQRAAWKQHKLMCAALAVAASGATAAGGPAAS